MATALTTSDLKVKPCSLSSSSRLEGNVCSRLGVIVICNSNSNSKDYRQQCNSNSNIIEILDKKNNSNSNRQILLCNSNCSLHKKISKRKSSRYRDGSMNALADEVHKQEVPYTQ